MYKFQFPDLGEGVHEGEILSWHVQVGREVDKDAPLVEVETDKAAVMISSPVAGRLVDTAGGQGHVVKVGEVLAIIESADDVGKLPAPATGAGSQRDEGVPTGRRASAATVGARVPASPATRRVARELGVDLALIPTTEPAGRVSIEDVKNFVASQDSQSGVGAQGESDEEQSSLEGETEAHVGRASSASGIPFLEVTPLPDFEAFGDVERVALRSIRRKIARKMVSAAIIAPHVAHFDQCDITELERGRRQLGVTPPGKRIGLLPFLIKAIAIQLRKHRKLNSSLDLHKNEIVFKKYYNVGVATHTGAGLVVPVVMSADRLSILEIAEKVDDLAERGRSGKLKAQEMQKGTFTITNLGSIGGTVALPTINYPEAAILGMGRASEQPVVREGEIMIRTILPLTIAYDHRLIDGAEAAFFLRDVISCLESPLLLAVSC